MTETVLWVLRDVEYLPKPNTVEVVATDNLSPAHLTRTAFMLPVFDDGSVLFAMHQQRDLEVAGGHIEPGEDAMSAAIRETLEETGGEVKDIQPIGYLRMTSSGKVTDPWPYPHPLSYQQFFAGRVVKQHEYMANDECAKPVRISGPFDALMGTMKISACLFAKRAVETFNEK